MQRCHSSVQAKPQQRLSLYFVCIPVTEKQPLVPPGHKALTLLVKCPPFY